MDNIHEEFAAIAVTGELYNAGKDIYDVLAAYLLIIIQSDNLNNFTCTDITEIVNKTNSFSVSESIVKTALKRLRIKRSEGYYRVEDELISACDDSELIEQTRKNTLVVNRLFSFVAKDQEIVLSDSDKHNIEKQFYSILSDPEYDDTYTTTIRKFIIENDMDESFHESISKIRDGLLVYEGICFSPEIGLSGKWDIPLDIYLEQEVLFYIAGYNGDTYRDIYYQLIDYVNEINSSRTNKETKLINLYYTADVKREIENYFGTAETIFDKNEVVDPSKSAMIYILNGVTTKRDILVKKTRFFNFLSNCEITVKDVDFCSEENSKYYLVSPDTYPQIADSIDSDRGEEYICNCADKINQINVLRKNNNSSLKDARSILLTANGTVLKCAYAPNLFNEGDTPKAVNLDYLLTRFWYKLNKGFGKGKTPKSIDIITRAQMILSSMIVTKVSKAYDDIKLQYEKGEINDEEVAVILSELRRVPKNPEDVTPDKIEEEMSFLTDYELNNKIENIRREQIERQRDKETIVDLQSQIVKLDELRADENRRRDEREEQLERRIIELENQASKDQQINSELVKTIQDFIDLGNKRRLMIKKICRGIIFIACMLLILIAIFVVCLFIFHADRSISGVISIALTVLIAIFSHIKDLWKKFVVDCKLRDEKQLLKNSQTLK